MLLPFFLSVGLVALASTMLMGTALVAGVLIAAGLGATY
jgi:hypothetical protein